MSDVIEHWCSMKEIIEYLSACRDIVLSWIEKYNMPTIKFGRLWTFRISDIDT